ncbi:MAG: ribonuclease P protein component [Patescibacteria group bacterium]
MLKKINRLKNDKDFARVFKTGHSCYDRTLSLRMSTNNLGYNRFGIVVSNKVSKKAIVRNKIKRQIRVVIRSQLAKIKNGYDIVIIAQPEILDNGSRKTEKVISNHFKKLNMYA